MKVIDRSALILDIFAQHANTREGSLQVELAQYEYRLPRLTRQWTHLARQAGGSGSKAGVGLRGPGETQLEVDRREIGRKITKLKTISSRCGSIAAGIEHNADGPVYQLWRSQATRMPASQRCSKQ
ncbi:hypothetical protein HC928_06525 [bacterium]|nr:hypothetical protein [bacterium]